MRSSALWIVARREIRDLLGDWRVMVPVVVLSLLLPLLLANASALAMYTLDHEWLSRGMIPFSLLLVGFVPASFSVITALEVFVGERERGTLEILFGTPLSDRDIYLGKLVSALYVPLASSYGAMLLFTLLLALLNREALFAMLGGMVVGQAFLVVGLLAVNMVAGAVVLSSHAATIRAANLMLSFLLIPATLVVQVTGFAMVSENAGRVLLVVFALIVLAVLLIRVGMASFSREELLAREHQDMFLVRWWRHLWGAQRRATSASAPTAADTPDEPMERREYDNAEPLVQRPVSWWRALWLVARREIRDTLSDWHVLLPVLLLTCVVPLVLIGGAGYAIDAAQDRAQVAQVVPFVVLLVGFVPASFALVTALETFVGERERGTLESLLALPISDTALYTGKLVSALVVPLLTSYGAMLFFTYLLASLYPLVYAAAIHPLLLLQLLLLVSALALVMVASAVIISSHTRSIRAANLLAGFVLVPMTIITALQLLLFRAGRLDMVWVFMVGLVVVAIGLIRTGALAFHREEILSRENQELNVQRIWQHFVLCFREYHPAGVPFEAYSGKASSLRCFYRHELPALLRELRLPLGMALLALSSGLSAGYYIFATAPGIVDVDYVLRQTVGVPGSAGPLSALVLFGVSLQVSVFSALASLFSLGIFAFVWTAASLAQTSFVASALQARGGDWLQLGGESPLQYVLVHVLPQGIVEIPLLLLSTALGVRLGASVLSPPPGFTVGQNMLWSLANFARVWLLVLVPLMLLGALVEGFISPLLVQAVYGS